MTSPCHEMALRDALSLVQAAASFLWLLLGRTEDCEDVPVPLAHEHH